MTRHLICALIVALPGSVIASRQATPAVGASVDAPEGTPVVVPRAKQYDITSRINGETYRIMVSTPVEADPAVAYPVVYLLDGNVHFNTATDAVTRMSLRIPPPTVAPAIVVGLGYPTHDPEEVNRRRQFDLTLSHSPSPLRPDAKGGGGDTFLRVIEEELKPFVMARYRIDRTKQIIYGQSLGGLMSLRVLFRNPNAFSSYILSSPSIFHNNREVLADEEAFSKRARAGELRLRVLVTSAADEQYPGDANRMVDNASELADRLAALNPSKIMVVRTIFADETHISVSPASLSRGLRFALPLN